MKNLFKLVKIIKLKYPVLGVKFSDQESETKETKDTICTGLARAFKKEEKIIFNRKNKQICSGGDYFFKLKEIEDNEAVDIYVNKEHIFDNIHTCKKFLNKLPKFDETKISNSNIEISPLEDLDDYDVVLMLVNPAQTNRIIGLANYSNIQEIRLLPNQPTCISLFAPLVTNQIHINFIDYYDRYHQGKVDNKLIWPEDMMILSMKKKIFEEILNNIEKSPQGCYMPEILPKKVDSF